jgi:hypothetical protein
VLDTNRLSLDLEALDVWGDKEAVQALKRSRFVTGDWEGGEARDGARPRLGSDDDAGESDDDGGTFEDMETGVPLPV